MHAGAEARRDRRAGDRDGQNTVPGRNESLPRLPAAQLGSDGIGLALEGDDLSLELGLAAPQLTEQVVLLGHLGDRLLAQVILGLTPSREVLLLGRHIVPGRAGLVPILVERVAEVAD